ncbi:MAG: TIGR03915 family putative DNA repair protein [Tannerella sp.]|jgi:probable DNA metabolism protein|nr:TIGR03915 family putative DNA repair protein [Tannerella sp.]
MIAFRYDQSFEGLLTALFDAYSRREFPERLLSPGEVPPLFVESPHEVLSDPVKAARVWKGVRRRLKQGVCNMLLQVWLSELPGSDELLFRYLRKVFDARDAVSVVTDFTDKDVLETQQIARKVDNEREHLLQFVRFQKTADGIYFAPVAPIYNVLPLTTRHFAARFADQPWLIYDLKRHYGYYYDLKSPVEVQMADESGLMDGQLDASRLAPGEQLFQKAWKNYTVALTIRERLNPKLQRQFMPRRFWKYMPETS